MQGQGDGGGRGVAVLADAERHLLLRQPQAVRKGVDDPLVGLMGHQHPQVVHRESLAFEDRTYGLAHTVDRYLEDALAVLPDVWLWCCANRFQGGRGAAREGAVDETGLAPVCVQAEIQQPAARFCAGGVPLMTLWAPRLDVSSQRRQKDVPLAVYIPIKGSVPRGLSGTAQTRPFFRAYRVPGPCPRLYAGLTVR